MEFGRKSANITVPWKHFQFVDCQIQWQPSVGVLIKRCSENMQQIYSRIPLPKCDFNKMLYNKNSLQHPVNMMLTFRWPFNKNTFGMLLVLDERFTPYKNPKDGSKLIQKILARFFLAARFQFSYVLLLAIPVGQLACMLM